MSTPYVYVLAKGGSFLGSTIHPHYGVRTLATRDGKPPRGLDGLHPESHTWEMHVQRAINGEAVQPPTGTAPELKPHQVPRVEEIAAGHAAGLPGYVCSYPTGSGKTYIGIGAINAIAPRKVLVITPLSHVEGWRWAIVHHGTSRTEWVVTNPEQLVNLFALPNAAIPLHEIEASQRARIAIGSGMPLEQFDVVITDEAQILAHTDPDRVRLWRRLVGWPLGGDLYDPRHTMPTAFTINLSATAWTTPSETSSAAHLLASAVGAPCPSEDLIEADYDSWLRDRIHLSGTRDARGHWYWADNTGDVKKITGLLYDAGLGATTTREELGLPSQERRLGLIHLTPTDRARYELQWTELREQLNLPTMTSINPSDSRTRYQRLLQAAALIKAPYVAELVVDALANGYQVVVPAWYSETVIRLQQEIKEALRRRFDPDTANKTHVLALTGDTPPSKRSGIVRTFQSGYAPVLITSIMEAISLHAGQKGGGIPDRTTGQYQDATDTPRITIFIDVITGGKRAFQAEGRAARDGNEAPVIYTCATGTSEVEALGRVFRKLTNTRALNSLDFDDADILSFEDLATELEDLADIDPNDPTIDPGYDDIFDDMTGL